MGAARAELDHALPRGRLHHARGLAGDERLMVDRREEERLDDLCLDQRRTHPHERLTGEGHGALGNRVHVAGEAKPGQVLPKAGGCPGEHGQAAEVVDAPAVEAHREQELDGLREAGRDQEAPVLRQLAHEELERADRRGETGVEIGRAHGELVEVRGDTGASGVVQRVERAHPRRGIASINCPEGCKTGKGGPSPEFIAGSDAASRRSPRGRSGGETRPPSSVASRSATRSNGSCRRPATSIWW